MRPAAQTTWRVDAGVLDLFAMGRKSASPKRRFHAAAVSWVFAVLLVQSTSIAGVGAGGAARKLEERIELELRRRNSPPAAAQPQRTHEDSIDPWELVSV